MLTFLLKVTIGFALCVIIYALILKFNELIKTHDLYIQLLNTIKDEYINQLLNMQQEMSSSNEECDSIYDKTDEELLEDWNNLWDGNPPCELDLKAIREEEKREKENKMK